MLDTLSNLFRPDHNSLSVWKRSLPHMPHPKTDATHRFLHHG